MQIIFKSISRYIIYIACLVHASAKLVSMFREVNCKGYLDVCTVDCVQIYYLDQQMHNILTVMSIS